MKEDINLDYETYGRNGDKDYVSDNNTEYDSMYDDVEDECDQKNRRHEVYSINTKFY